MRSLHAFPLVAACLFWATTAPAQRRLVGDAVLLPEAQVEVALKDKDYLLATFNLVRFSDSGGSTFAGSQLRLGYEHFWSEQWSGGATLRVLGPAGDGFGDFLGQTGNLIPGLLLRHTGSFGAFTFGQRLGAEYATTVSTAGSQIQDRALARLRLDAERQFPLGGQASLRPRLAYEVAAYLRLQRGPDEIRERVVDFGTLRAEVGVRLSPRLDLTPWAASQTWYINAYPQFNSSGVQVRGGRSNLLVTLLGLDVRLTLGSGQQAIDRRQLPTQH